MAVYVDGAKNPLKHMRMSHMLADSEAELHAMAHAIGLKREWFQDHGTQHYDLCQSKRQLAVQRGAIQVGRRELVAIIRRLRQARDAAAKASSVDGSDNGSASFCCDTDDDVMSLRARKRRMPTTVTSNSSKEIA